MKTCSICGCQNPTDAERCYICGVKFPKAEVPVQPVCPVVVPVHTQKPVSQKTPENNKSDRMAIAGFVLSLLGTASWITSPLQLAALLLSLASGKTKRFLGLRRTGLILSSISLGISLLFWLIVLIFSSGIFSFLTDIMNEFYY